jgi:hypothetical protein
MFFRVVIFVIICLVLESPAFAQVKKVDVAALKQLLVAWNGAHSVDHVNTFSSLFADTVNFYGKTLTRKECVDMKQSLFRKYKNFHQVIKGDMVLSAYESGVIRSEFVKTVSYNNKIVDYKSYLLVRRSKGRYIIFGESDVVTDHNLQIDPDFGKQIAIRNSTPEEAQEEDLAEADISSDNDSESSWLYMLGVTLVGVVGIVLVTIIWRRRLHKQGPDVQVSRMDDASADVHVNERVLAREPDWISQRVHINKRKQRNDVPSDEEQYCKGIAFEQYVVSIFSKRKDYFFLMDWRSDKFHEGIYPQSNRNPDLVYDYRCGSYVRQFAVECKYRAKPIKGYVSFMKITTNERCLCTSC